MIKVCLVHADFQLAASLADNGRQNDFAVYHIRFFSEALHKLRTEDFDVIIIAWNLPDGLGTELCRRYRAAQGAAPILIMGSTDFVNDTTQAFQAGADDFIPKTYYSTELFARIRALSRRSRVYCTDILRAGNLVLDPTSRRVYKDGMEVHLLAKEFNLLELLMRYPRHNFSAEAILERVWNSHHGSTDTVRTHIKTLRQKLGEDLHTLIVTRRGLGYCLEPQGETGSTLVLAR